ncbi:MULTISPECIES: hypothetical protein [unclassified Methylophaga]|jgi:hypothetical protein|uniref:hypothetical protein n=1 Tax=unclassified Methylophaga TaxID=2629249 RepID=UPI00259C94E0|nr:MULTISPECIES: hypothetical protein [unclassified Methylophaga]|tara:strand:+ start:41829 stop:42251 length:423 start_codon:yes stop_codon:yes gene_type:complete
MSEEYDMSIHTNPDAKAWSEFYKKTFPEADEELMLGWFANAMMAMYDHLHNKKIEPLHEQQHRLIAKLGLISLAADEGNMAKVKELIPPSCTDVVREIQAEAINDFCQWCSDRGYLHREITNEFKDEYVKKLRNPGQEKV